MLPAGWEKARKNLAAKTEALDQRAVTLDVDALEVAKKAAALTDQEKQPTTRVVVVLVRLQVFGEFVNPVRHQSNLNLGRTGVAGVGLVLLNDGLFFFGGHRHVSTLLFLCLAARRGTLLVTLSLSAAGLRHKSKA
jgi:hypothetical protein